MHNTNDGWLRTPRAVALLLAVLMMSLALALGAGFVAINRFPAADAGAVNPAERLTDEQSRDQVIHSAQQIVRVAKLRDATGGYTFLSCKNESEPPYQGAVYLNFRLSETNWVKQLREIATAMVEHGWKEAPSMGEHFGKKLTKDGVTSIFHRNLDDASFATMRIYGECRNMANHRDDNPAWTDIADQLR